MKMKSIWTIACTLTMLAACATPHALPTSVPTQVEVVIPTKTAQASLPNPASVYCEQQGNQLEIRTAPGGSQAGVCIFPNGSECDEWAYYRKECAPAPDATDTAAVIPTSPVHSPDLVTPDPSLYAGWIEYTDPAYGFKFRYPPEWSAELDLRSDSTSYQHLLWLRAPSKPLPGVVMQIAFEGVGEDYGLQRTGIGAGELIERGSVSFLGEPVRRIALVLQGNDMEVMYGTTGLFDRGDLRFAISLDYTGVERRGLTPALEETADLIVASFERTK
jgi:putative hemolysin